MSIYLISKIPYLLYWLKYCDQTFLSNTFHFLRAIASAVANVANRNGQIDSWGFFSWQKPLNWTDIDWSPQPYWIVRALEFMYLLTPKAKQAKIALMKYSILQKQHNSCILSYCKWLKPDSSLLIRLKKGCTHRCLKEHNKGNIDGTSIIF